MAVIGHRALCLIRIRCPSVYHNVMPPAAPPPTINRPSNFQIIQNMRHLTHAKPDHLTL
ncbi:MAG: hypothetical protein K8L91_24465 [Anaerolineae bacterium]|nr:hypothetical protein [Anaerolineae bacterium]